MNFLEALKIHIGQHLSNVDHGIKFYEQSGMYNPALLKLFKQGQRLEKITDKDYSVLKPIAEKLEYGYNKGNRLPVYNISQFGPENTGLQQRNTKSETGEKETQDRTKTDTESGKAERLEKIRGLHEELVKSGTENTAEANEQRKEIAKQMGEIYNEKEELKVDPNLLDRLMQAEKGRSNAMSNVSRYNKKIKNAKDNKTQDHKEIDALEADLEKWQIMYIEESNKIRQIRFEIKKQKNGL